MTMMLYIQDDVINMMLKLMLTMVHEDVNYDAKDYG